MSQHAIRDIIEDRLKAWAAARSPTVPIAWENVPFTPPTSGGYYVQASVLPAPTDDGTLEGGRRVYTGVYQVLAKTNLGKGAAPAEFLLSTLDSAFSATPLSAGGLIVNMTRPWTARPGYPDGSRWCVPLDFSYAATTYV